MQTDNTDDLGQGEVVSTGVEAAVEVQVDNAEDGSLVTTQCSHALAAVEVPAAHRTIVRTCR